MLYTLNIHNFNLKFKNWDFPGGPVVKNLPCNAGDASSIPGQGTRIPHTMEPLSQRATTTEPHALESESHN